MQAISRGLAAAALSFVFATQASAAPFVVSMGRPAAVPVSPAAVAAHPAGVVFSNFSSVGHSLYDCCMGWGILGPTNGYGPTESIALPFTPATDTHLTQVRVAVSHLANTNALKVSVLRDVNGLPGRVMGELEIDDVPPYQSCCTTRAVRADGLFLKGGQQYWIAVRPGASDTYAAWNFNDTTGDGPMAYDDGTGVWNSYWGTVPAAAVYGR